MGSQLERILNALPPQQQLSLVKVLEPYTLNYGAKHFVVLLQRVKECDEELMSVRMDE
jgi:hypothetical protein